MSSLSIYGPRKHLVWFQLVVFALTTSQQYGTQEVFVVAQGLPATGGGGGAQLAPPPGRLFGEPQPVRDDFRMPISLPEIKAMDDMRSAAGLDTTSLLGQYRGLTELASDSRGDNSGTTSTNGTTHGRALDLGAKMAHKVKKKAGKTKKKIKKKLHKLEHKIKHKLAHPEHYGR